MSRSSITGAFFVGDVVDVTARIVHTGPLSIHIGIRAVTASAVGQPLLVAEGVVVVSLGVHGEAQPVPSGNPPQTKIAGSTDTPGT